MSRGRSLVQLVADRARKQGLYDSAAYWDMKAESYEGLARSIWPSNTYNAHWDARQRDIVDRELGDVRGASIVDVACGTGRMSRHLAARGANVTGLDFAPRALEAARRETEAAGLRAEFRTFDVLAPAPADLAGRFDVALTVGCLTTACADEAAFVRALGTVASLVRPGGRVLFVEPIHASRLLRRILRLDAGRWIALSESAGLGLERRGGMGFVPARLALAFRDWPERIVGPAFDAGEALLERFPRLDPLADYKWLLFRRGR